MSSNCKQYTRRQAIPILYTRGTHYEVGFDMGRTFSAMIKNYLSEYVALNETFIPLYNSGEGKKVYDDTLASVKCSFPQYVRELEGVADGAEVEFHKLFLMHLDEILPQTLKYSNGNRQCSGCTTIIANQKHCRLIGHTEDAVPETMNHYYFVVAHIISDKPQGKYNIKEEHFMSLCYAGQLPGYTINQNHHGLVFSINTICADKLRSGKTPRHFLTRALLATCNMDDAIRVLKDAGVGAADACSINMAFVSDPNKMCYNVEIGPSIKGNDESEISILEVPIGAHNYHFNQFNRLVMDQPNKLMLESSRARAKAFSAYKPPVCPRDVRNMLGDVSGGCFCLWTNRCNDVLKTICIALFDLNAKTVSLFSDNPSTTEPHCTLPMLCQNM